MISYNVITWNFNSKKLEHYDIMPYLIEQYKKHKPKEELKDFVINEGKYMWWGRCQYEIIISQWPPEKNPLDHSEKIDVWDQIEMNLDIVVDILKKNINELLC